MHRLSDNVIRSMTPRPKRSDTMWEVGQLQDDQIAGCIHGGMLNQGPICALLTIFIFLILQQLGAQTILITGVRIPGRDGHRAQVMGRWLLLRLLLLKPGSHSSWNMS